MKELGDILRSTREEKGMTHEEIFDLTKIQPRYLQALEEENFDIFPGEIYAKGSLKNYAQVLGLDEEMILEKYKDIKEREGPVHTEEKENEIKPLYTKRDGIWRNMVIGIIVVLVLFGGIKGYQEFFAFENNQEINDPNGQEEEIPSNNSEEDISNNELFPDNDRAREDEEDKKTPEPELHLVEESHNHETYELYNAEIIDLELEFTGDCWIRMEADDDDRDEATYRDMDTVNREAESKVLVRFGNPPAAKIKVNGMEINIAERTSRVDIEIELIEENDIENNDSDI